MNEQLPREAMTLVSDNIFPLTEGQREALIAAIDTFVPSINSSTPSQNSTERDMEFWHCQASDLDIDQLIVDTISSQSRAVRKDFSLLLRLLSSPVAGLLGGGLPASFQSMSLQKRERLLIRWSTSRIPDLRRAFSSLKRLTMFTYYSRGRWAEELAGQRLATHLLPLSRHQISPPEGSPLCLVKETLNAKP
ncbi:hypothetical protein [Veronia nyctiphanis]|uniref:hypothetical protein n=1 Tax=Veronia nyctiphanis TaxID=1278244 RepID=UPI001F1EA2CF|nr:hypothetical protein [Veronia nyctiphanis]